MYDSLTACDDRTAPTFPHQNRINSVRNVVYWRLRQVLIKLSLYWIDITMVPWYCHFRIESYNWGKLSDLYLSETDFSRLLKS